VRVESAGLIPKAALPFYAWGESCVERSGPSHHKVCGNLAGGFFQDRNRKLGAETLGPTQDCERGLPA